MIWIGISGFLILSYTILLIYYRQKWCSIPDYFPKQLAENFPFISIVIAARNEEKNIGNCIESILNQQYPSHRFQLIIINDHSTDRTENIISTFQDERLMLLHLKDFLSRENQTNSFKKRAIEIAIQHAKGDLIVTTDADCLTPPNWLQNIASFYIDKNAAFIAAPVSFIVPENGKSFSKKFLHIFQVLDFMTLQGITGASVHAGFHNMCNGANLAYEKNAFEEVKGFSGIDEIASGDDMLLMHKIQQKYPSRIFYLKSKNAIIKTHPEPTIKKFLNQRIRWASKSGKYQDYKIKFVLLLVYLLNVWMVALFIGSFINQFALCGLIISLVIKIAVELIFLFPVAKFFGQRHLLWWFIPAQPFHILYTIVAGWLGLFGKYQWKERRVQ